MGGIGPALVARSGSKGGEAKQHEHQEMMFQDQNRP
jgi:hypothetical protein